VSGCQHCFELLITEAVGRRPAEAALAHLTALLSANVARRFRIDKSKGRLAVGLDADMAILDLRGEHRVSNEELLYRHRQGPYDGRTSRARVVRTLVRGRTVFAQGRVAPGPACGHFIRPS
jgi:allantoinase